MLKRNNIYAVFIIQAIFFNIYSENPKEQPTVVASGDLPLIGRKVSKETEEYTNSILKKLNPNQELNAVVNSNRFIRYWFGYQNSIGLPFLNYLIINEDYFKTLDEESRRFLIGRGLVHIIKGKQYVLNTVALPFTALIAKKFLPSISMAIDLMACYSSRQVEYEVDKITAEKLDCANGGIALLKDLKQFKSDDSLLGSLCSTVPVITSFVPFYIIKGLIPGRLNDRSNKFSNYITNLPIIKYFRSHPRLKDRIKELRKLSNSTEENKEDEK